MKYIFLIFFATVTFCHALTISNDSSAYSRFSGGYPSNPTNNTSTFWATNLDLSGIGWTADGGKNYILITPRHVAFASHYVSSAGTTLYFKNTDGVIKTNWIQTVTSAGGDLSICTLSNAFQVSDKISSYKVICATNDLIGMQYYLYGNSSKMSQSNFVDSFGVSLYSSHCIGTSIDRAGAGVAVTGDSGSPSMIPYLGYLTAAGVHTGSSSSDTVSSSIGYYYATVESITSNTGYYLDKIFIYSNTLPASLSSNIYVARGSIKQNTISATNSSLVLSGSVSVICSTVFTNCQPITGSGTLRCGTLFYTNGKWSLNTQ